MKDRKAAVVCVPGNTQHQKIKVKPPEFESQVVILQNEKAAQKKPKQRRTFRKHFIHSIS